MEVALRMAMGIRTDSEYQLCKLPELVGMIIYARSKEW